jgi:hypothetical protein
MATKLKKALHQYANHHMLVTRLLYDRARRGNDDPSVEFNPDWVHPDLVRQLAEVDNLLVDYGGLTDTIVVAAIIQRWENSNFMSVTGLTVAYNPKNI